MDLTDKSLVLGFFEIENEKLSKYPEMIKYVK